MKPLIFLRRDLLPWAVILALYLLMIGILCGVVALVMEAFDGPNGPLIWFLKYFIAMPLGVAVMLFLVFYMIAIPLIVAKLLFDWVAENLKTAVRWLDENSRPPDV